MKKVALQLSRLRQLRRDVALAALQNAQGVYRRTQAIEDACIQAVSREVTRQFDELRRTDALLCAGQIGGSAFAEARSRHALILERVVDDRYAACHLASEAWVEMRMKAMRVARAERALNQSETLLSLVGEGELQRQRQSEEQMQDDWTSATASVRRSQSRRPTCHTQGH